MERGIREALVSYLISFFTLLSLDLYTKHLAEEYLSGREISILPFLHLVLVYNKGVAFGFLSSAPDYVRLPIILLTPILALIITLAYSLRKGDKKLSLLLGLIGGGAMGNFYDRLFLGEVRDFIYLAYGKLSWPAFNLADAGISIAIGVLIFSSLLSGKR